MTRLAILTDIHANLPALQAVIADMGSFSPDQVIVAGDLINGGLFDVEVIEEVLNRRWVAIRGNHEFYLLDHNTERESKDKRNSPLIQYLYETLADYLPYLAAMPDSLRLVYPDGPAIRVEHASPNNNSRAILPDTPDSTLVEWLAGVDENLYVCGHYHIGFERHVERWQILNPGPVGMSKNGYRMAHYALLEAREGQWHITRRSLEYDFSPCLHRYFEKGLADSLGLVGYLGMMQIRFARPFINAFLDWAEDQHPEKSQAELWEISPQFFDHPDVMWRYFGKYQVNRELLNRRFSLDAG